MRTPYDFSPLYKSMIGADRMADLVDSAMRSQAASHYPPYDIEKVTEDAYRITLATAGFARDELDVLAQPNLLVVSGRKADDQADRTFLHHGLARQSFERRFELADYVVVKSADYVRGLLSIELVCEVPEALKPRHIEIDGGERRIDPKQIERREHRATPHAA